MVVVVVVVMAFPVYKEDILTRQGQQLSGGRIRAVDWRVGEGQE